MPLDPFVIVILIIAGSSVGLSMSFIGQTGSGIVIPIVFILTGDIFLAIVINLLNDLIAASAVSISYIRNKNFKIRKDNFIFLAVSFVFAFLGVLILLTTNLSSTFSILLPFVFIILGIGIFRRGFPTTESVQKTIHSLTKRLFKGKKSEEELLEMTKRMDEQLIGGNEIFEGLFEPGSKIYYIAAVIMGVLLGLNCGIFGACGGFIIAIVLIIINGYPLKKAVGTALILSIVLCGVGFIFFQVLGYLFNSRYYFDLEISLYLGIGAFFVGIVSSIYVQKMSAKAMGTGMGAIMIVLGVITLIIALLP